MASLQVSLVDGHGAVRLHGAAAGLDLHNGLGGGHIQALGVLQSHPDLILEFAVQHGFRQLQDGVGAGPAGAGTDLKLVGHIRPVGAAVGGGPDRYLGVDRIAVSVHGIHEVEVAGSVLHVHLGGIPGGIDGAGGRGGEPDPGVGLVGDLDVQSGGSVGFGGLDGDLVGLAVDGTRTGGELDGLIVIIDLHNVHGIRRGDGDDGLVRLLHVVAAGADGVGDLQDLGGILVQGQGGLAQTDVDGSALHGQVHGTGAGNHVLTVLGVDQDGQLVPGLQVSVFLQDILAVVVLGLEVVEEVHRGGVVLADHVLDVHIAEHIPEGLRELDALLVVGQVQRAGDLQGHGGPGVQGQGLDGDDHRLLAYGIQSDPVIGAGLGGGVGGNGDGLVLPVVGHVQLAVGFHILAALTDGDHGILFQLRHGGIGGGHVDVQVGIVAVESVQGHVGSADPHLGGSHIDGQGQDQISAGALNVHIDVGLEGALVGIGVGVEGQLVVFRVILRSQPVILYPGVGHAQGLQVQGLILADELILDTVAIGLGDGDAGGSQLDGGSLVDELHGKLDRGGNGPLLRLHAEPDLGVGGLGGDVGVDINLSFWTIFQVQPIRPAVLVVRILRNISDGSALNIRHIGLLVIEAVDGQLGGGELGQILLDADVQGLLGKEILLVRGGENDLALVAALDLAGVLHGVVRGDKAQGPVVHDLQVEEFVHIVVEDDVIILILGAKLGGLDQMAQSLVGIIGIHRVGLIGRGAGINAHPRMDP